MIYFLLFKLCHENKEGCKDQESISQVPMTPYNKLATTQESMAYKRAKMQVLSQQVITRLQETDRLV